MYDVIQITDPNMQGISQFNIGRFTERTDSCDQLYMEAVFANGKKQVMPLVETIQKIKDELDRQIELQESSQQDVKDAARKRRIGERVKQEKVQYFDPKAFWKNELFKELEDRLSNIFGFRYVSINPYIEKYISREKIFESREMNAMVYNSDRFPIEGLVTDKGFYDKTKSVQMQVYFSLGLLKELTAEEVLAVFLHEFGHSIDPALVDIKYTETNILTKYMTDRRHAINKSEKKFIESRKVNNDVIIPGIVYLIIALFSIIPNFVRWIHDLIIGKDEVERRKLEKIRNMVKADKEKFSRQEYSEAYADNFARMYGFGPQLISGIKKLSKSTDNELRSRIKKEKERQEIIVNMTCDLIDDVHKTDIHRARALIREYKADIEDPNTPAPVRKQLQEDLTELEKVLDSYMNDFDDFQNKVNKVINEELMNMEDNENK